MATLTGQPIKDTYDGLLKLADSTAGITANLQQIQDGVGNDTGLRITTDQLESPNIPSLIRLKARYYGLGFNATSPQQMTSGTQNIILAQPFYDSGLYSYSAISYNLVTASTTSDTCDVAIYTSQMINPFGLYPSAPIISGISVSTTGSLGVRTTTTSSFSMSGYGGGVYWLVFKISNSGVQPTVRYGNARSNTLFPESNVFLNTIYGVWQTLTTNQFTTGIRPNAAAAGYYAFTGQTTFDNPFSTTINTLQSSSTALVGGGFGFVLHTEGAT